MAIFVALLVTLAVVMVGRSNSESPTVSTLAQAKAASNETTAATLAPTTLAPTTLAPTTIAPTTVAPTTVAPTTTTTALPIAVQFNCLSPGSVADSLTPTIAQVVSPVESAYSSAASVHLTGTNLGRYAGTTQVPITEALLCPSNGTAPSAITVTSGFSWSGSQANIYVPTGLVAGGIYDIRVVVGGLISAVAPSDRLFVSYGSPQGAGA